MLLDWQLCFIGAIAKNRSVNRCYSFAKTCISGILKSSLPIFMHKHVDHGQRSSVLLQASKLAEFHDTSSYQDALAILLCLLL